MDPSQSRTLVRGLLTLAGVCSALWMLQRLERIVLVRIAAILWPLAAQQLDDAIASAPASTESFRVWERGWTRSYVRAQLIACVHLPRNRPLC